MFRPTVLGAVCLSVFAAGAGAATLPIKPGDYVRDGAPCRDAPFAALMRFDGRSFSGPHDSDCTTVSLAKPHGRTFSLQTTCRAAGDGTPNGSHVEAQTVKVLSPTRFTFVHRTGADRSDRAGYRLCHTTAAR